MKSNKRLAALVLGTALSVSAVLAAVPVATVEAIVVTDVAKAVAIVTNS